MKRCDKINVKSRIFRVAIVRFQYDTFNILIISSLFCSLSEKIHNSLYRCCFSDLNKYLAFEQVFVHKSLLMYIPAWPFSLIHQKIRACIKSNRYQQTCHCFFEVRNENTRAMSIIFSKVIPQTLQEDTLVGSVKFIRTFFFRKSGFRKVYSFIFPCGLIVKKKRCICVEGAAC